MVEAMDGGAWQEVQESLGDIGKHWGLGESVWRVWSCILFKSCPVSRKEIEKGTGYSTGMIRITLQKLKIANMIKETIMGGDTLYYVNTSLTDAFGTFSKQLFEENIKPMLAVLSENIDKIENPKVKKTCQELVNEYQKLNLLMLIQSRIIEHINTIAINVDLEDVQEAG
jgi:DNA-binding transcriptional regulator GbsR (MarR family)